MTHQFAGLSKFCVETARDQFIKLLLVGVIHLPEENSIPGKNKTARIAK
jgi:hypothetical protein